MVYAQVPHSILMVRPASFGYNPETRDSNAFQKQPEDPGKVARQAVQEFDKVVQLLKENNINVIVVDDTLTPVTTDAVFPNNWFTTHQDGKVILYPMMAISRRNERRQDIIDLLAKSFMVNDLIDLSFYEKENKFLEGTGSIIFDHVNRIAYACRSPRTDDFIFTKLCNEIGYNGILFNAYDQNGKAIYHTNVMMWIGEKLAGVCVESIAEDDQEIVLNSLTNTGHKIVALSFQQMNSFAGNMIEVKNSNGDRFLLMSQTAHDSLVPGQINEMKKYLTPLAVRIPTIEESGGGSIRCMVAGIHLPGL